MLCICGAAPGCAAYTFSAGPPAVQLGDVAEASCRLYRQYGTTAPAPTTHGVGILLGAYLAFTVSVRATNGAGLTTEVSSRPIVVDTAPPLPPEEVAVLDTAACENNAWDLNLLRRQTIGATEVGATAADGWLALCVGFSPGSDGESGVEQYVVGVGFEAGGTTLLPFTRVTEENLRVVIADNGLPVFKYRSRHFPVQHLSAVYVTLRAFDTAGNYADAVVGPVVVVSQPPSTAGFFAWASEDRTTVRAMPATSRRVSLSWTGPGADAARAAWFTPSAYAPIPSGLARFEVSLSPSHNASTPGGTASWQDAGYNQSAVITGERWLDTCMNMLAGVEPVGAVQIAVTSIGADTVKSIPDCCAACNRHDACVAFTFAEAGCSLLRSVVAVRATDQSANALFGYIGGPMAVVSSRGSDRPVAVTRQGVRPPPGGSSPTLDHPNTTVVASPDACSALCGTLPDCIGYTVSAKVLHNTSMAFECWPFESISSLIADVNASTTVRSPASPSPLYGLVTAVSNAGLRTTVATQPVSFVLAAPLPGRAHLPGWIGGTPLVRCRWDAFWDLTTPLVYYARLITPGQQTLALQDMQTGAGIHPAAGMRKVEESDSADFVVANASWTREDTVACWVIACNAGGLCTSAVSAPAGVDMDAPRNVDIMLRNVSVQHANYTHATLSEANETFVSATATPQHTAAAQVTQGAILSFTWPPAECGRSGLESYSLCVTLAQTSCSLVFIPAISPAQQELNVRLESPIVSGSTVYTTLTAVCGNGASAAATRSTVVDATPPVPPVDVIASASPFPLSVLQALGTFGGTSQGENANASAVDQDQESSGVPLWRATAPFVQNRADPFHCAWGSASDPELAHLGLMYRVGYAYLPDDSAAMSVTDVGASHNFTFHPSNVTDGGGSFVEGLLHSVLFISNAAGLTSSAVSGPVAADWEPPEHKFAVVSDGPIADIDLDMSAEACGSLSATWRGFYDAGTGIRMYETCVTTMDSVALCNAQTWGLAAGSDRHTFANVTMLPGATYSVCVRAWDYTGRVSSAVCSDGMLMDCAPPKVTDQFIVDTVWEEVRQAESLQSTGWPFSHLLRSAGTHSSLISAMLKPLPPSHPAVVKLFEVALPSFPLPEGLDSQQTEAVLNAIFNATGMTFFARPRLTVGSVFGEATSANRGTSCAVSSRPFEAFQVHVHESGDGLAGAENAAPATSNVDLAGVPASINVVCAAGTTFEPALDACVPCPDGTYKFAAGPGACARCGPDTLSSARMPRIITDAAQQRRTMSGGAVTCECWDVHEVYDAPTGSCLCASGFVRNASEARPVWRPDSTLAQVSGLCVPIDDSTGDLYKSLPGDSPSLARRCPPGSVPNSQRNGCQCTIPGHVFSPSDGTCTCPAGTYLAQLSLEDAVVASCVACPSGSMKTSRGDSRELCKPCPWGTVAGSSPGTCVINADIISGDGAYVSAESGVATCRAGFQLEAEYGPYVQRGIRVSVYADDGGDLAAGTQACLPVTPSMITPDTRVPQSGGVALVPGATVRLHPSNDTVTNNGAVYPFAPLLERGRAAAVLQPLGARLLTVETGTCQVQAPAFLVRCDPCPDGTFYPEDRPLVSEADVKRLYMSCSGGSPGGPETCVSSTAARCSACPALLRGTYFASNVATLFLDWSGIFTDGDGSGIVAYEFALGSVRGGSQVRGFSRVDANVTTTTVTGFDLSSTRGVPVYLTVVAIDAAGNRGVFEDTRPVLLDTTPPLVGFALDASLDEVFDASAAKSDPLGARDGVIRTDDNAQLASEPNFHAVIGMVRKLTAIDAALRVGDNDEALRLAALPELGFVDRTEAVNVTGNATQFMSAGWRNNPFFNSLAGVPDMSWQNHTSAYAIAWEPVQDIASGISAVGICVGSLPFACDIMPMTLRGLIAQTVDSVRFADLDLPPGVPVYGTVFAVNGVGMTSATTTNGIIADDRAPTPGFVYDVGAHFSRPAARTFGALPGAPVPVDVDCDVEGTGVGAVWEDFVSAIGMHHYEWAVGTAPGREDVVPYTDVGLDTSVFNATLPTQAMQALFVCVRAVAVNGASAMACSDGVVILPYDTEPDGSDSLVGGPASVSDGMFACTASRLVVDIPPSSNDSSAAATNDTAMLVAGMADLLATLERDE